jgi:hypothetical protein
MRTHGAKKGLRAGNRIRVGWAVVKKEGGAELLIRQAASRIFHSIFRPLAMRAQQGLDSPASRDQINDRDNQGDHQQEMDQAAGHVESPAQEPQDDEDCKNRPKHRYPFKSESYNRQPPKVRGCINGRSCL